MVALADLTRQTRYLGASTLCRSLICDLKDTAGAIAMTGGCCGILHFEVVEVVLDLCDINLVVTLTHYLWACNDLWCLNGIVSWSIN